MGDVRAGRAEEAHGKLMVAKERDNDAAHNSESTDLITGHCEVVLGEVVPRLCELSWTKRPILRLLNQSWNKALEERFPIYHQCLHNPPNILSNALILSHIKKFQCPSDEASYRLVGLWVSTPENNNCNLGDSAVTVRLPEHPLLDVPKYTKFLCDNHHVFSLTPSFVTEDTEAPTKIYNVWMLDLRDFNIHWKRLPPLPRLGKYVYASSSLNGDESSYIWQRRQSDSSEAEGWKLSASRKLGDKDLNSLNCEWHWDYFNVNTRPPTNLNFDIMPERLPLYVETEEVYDDDVMKTLFRRCSIPQYTVHKNNIFMLLDGMISSSSDYKFCSIIVDGGRICILNMGWVGERSRIVGGQEWNYFVEYWNDETRGQGKYEKPNKWHLHSQEMSAIKVSLGIGRWRLQKLEVTEKADDEIVKMHSTVRVAQKGPIYGYSYLGSKFETRA
eukprot:PITA_16881